MGEQSNYFRWVTDDCAKAMVLGVVSNRASTSLYAEYILPFNYPQIPMDDLKLYVVGGEELVVVDSKKLQSHPLGDFVECLQKLFTKEQLEAGLTGPLIAGKIGYSWTIRFLAIGADLGLWDLIPGESKTTPVKLPEI